MAEKTIRGENTIEENTNRLGEIRNNNKGTPMKIIAYRSNDDIDIQFQFDDVDAESVCNIVEHLSKKFTTNTVVALPDKVSLESCSKDVLENIISMIAEIIEQL